MIRFFLSAVAEINANPRLLTLEQNIGEVKRKFTWFYIPKDKQRSYHDSVKVVAQALEAFGASKDYAKHLIDQNQAHVSLDGRVRLFDKDDAEGAMELHQDEHKKWQHRTEGKIKKEFYSVSQNSNKLHVYLDPFSFLNAHPKNAFKSAHHHDDLLVLTHPDPVLIEGFSSGHRNIKEIELFHSEHSQSPASGVELFTVLKSKHPDLMFTLPQHPSESLSKSKISTFPRFRIRLLALSLTCNQPWVYFVIGLISEVGSIRI